MAVAFAMLMLPVADLERAGQFYRAVFGWEGVRIGPDAVQLTTGDQTNLILVATDYLAAESGMETSTTARASLKPIAVASVASSADVDRHEIAAKREGATITSSSRARAFSVYSVYFSDPDNNSWEVLTQI